jgi:hypothetical protein
MKQNDTDPPLWQMPHSVSGRSVVLLGRFELDWGVVGACGLGQIINI